MKVSFLRHAQTQANRERVLQGRADMPINEEGIAQARELAAKWQDISFDRVYCSELLRARQTADILLEGRREQVVFDSRLTERGFGSYELRPISELLAAGFDWDRSYRDVDYTLHGVETLGSMRKRIFSFLDELQGEPLSHVLVISHGAVVTLFHLYFYGGPLEWERLRLENCDTSDFVFQRRDSS